jgi:hypothetical protein
MSHQNKSGEDALLSPADMKVWLQIETEATQLAAQQRIAEANALVQKYVVGEVGTEEANRLLDAHENRWEVEGTNSPVWSHFKDSATAAVQRRRLGSRQGKTNQDRSR